MYIIISSVVQFQIWVSNINIVVKDQHLQLRGNQKDFNFQLHHRFSKFEVPVVVNLKHIFELFGLYTTCFLIQKLLELIRLSSDGQFWRKSQNKKGGKFELRSQLCYCNCTYKTVKSVHFKKKVARSSFLSKLWYFSIQIKTKFNNIFLNLNILTVVVT